MRNVKDLMDVFGFELEEAVEISEGLDCLDKMVEADKELTHNLEKTQIRLDNLETLVLKLHK